MRSARMQRFLAMLVCALLLIPGTVAAQTKLVDNVDQAVTILEHFREIPEQAIPEALMRDAKGLAILRVLKAGFLFSGQGGLGLVVGRTMTGKLRVEQGRRVIQGRAAGVERPLGDWHWRRRLRLPGGRGGDGIQIGRASWREGVDR